jgi:ATP-dependent DNA helicase RecQ
MRNQVEYGDRFGIKVNAIHSGNQDEHEAIFESITSNSLDLLLISPERLANQKFIEQASNAFLKSGLLVIDEAHCISDWGHDFRPDFRRIRNIINSLPPNIPVLATTATANNRVVEDVVEQLGSELKVIRGSLARESLSLHADQTPRNRAYRLALVKNLIGDFSGTGIIYCLTIQDANLVGAWLESNNISTGIYTGETNSILRPEIEQSLINNEIKVVVATQALGMGFDKSEISFVIHFQTPPSPSHYYQQVGRAGRNINSATGYLMRGTRDHDIWEYFINDNIFTDDEVTSLLSELRKINLDTPASLSELQKNLNIRRGRLDKLLKKLEVEGFIIRSDPGYEITAKPWKNRFDDLEKLLQHKYRETSQIEDFLSTDVCRMQKIRSLLDDQAIEICGKCDICQGVVYQPPTSLEISKAKDFLLSYRFPIIARRQWFKDGKLARIPKEFLIQDGQALSTLNSEEFGQKIIECKRNHIAYPERFADELSKLIKMFPLKDRPKLLAYVPSVDSDRNWVKKLAEDIAKQTGLRVYTGLRKNRKTLSQKLQENSYFQYRNVEGAFVADEIIADEPIYLLDDVVDSKWTITVVGSILREAGASKVFPIALAVAKGDS